MCPKTVSLVEALPRHHKHAFFSALAPGTHVVKHNGESQTEILASAARGVYVCVQEGKKGTNDENTTE